MKTILILIIVCTCLTGCSINEDKNKENYSAYKTSQNLAIENNEDSQNIKKDEKNKETDLSSFSTKIYTPNDQARQKNITITCSSLNGTIVKPGETFSFCNTVRKSNP